MNPKRKSLAGILLLTASMSAQEAPKTFDLETAVKHALSHNRTVQNADLATVAAKAQKWEAIARGLPQINGKIDYIHNVKRPFDVAASGNESFEFFFPKYNITPDLTLTQLVFDGSYLVGLEAAKMYLEISQNAFKKTRKEIETAVIRAYGNVLLTQESTSIQEKNIRSLEENLRETTLVYNNGLTEQEDVQQLQLTLSDLKNGLKNLQNMRGISKGFLKILLGIPLETPIELTDELDDLTKRQWTLTPSKKTFDPTETVDYEIAANEVESKRLLHKLERFKQLPSLSAFASNRQLGYSNSLSSYLNGEQQWLATTVVGASLNIPIFSSLGGNARRKKAKLDWEMARNNLTDTQEKIILDYEKAESEFTLAIDTYHNKKENLALATTIERKNTFKFKEGLASSFELRQAQLQLYSSQQAYLQAMVDLINKKAELKKIANNQ